MIARIERSERDWRYGRLRDAMAGQGIDGLLAFAPGWRREDVHYLAGATVESSFSFAYLPAGGEPCAVTLTDADAENVRAAGWIDDVRPLDVPGAARLAERLREDGGPPERLGVGHLELLPSAIAAALRRALAGTELVSASGLLSGVRLVKSAWEIAQLRRCAVLCDEGWRAFTAALRPGLAEYELIAEVESALKAGGAEDNFMLIASGGDEVLGMTPPSERRLRPGDMVRTELTPRVNGYWAQICRSAVLGTPSDGQRESFALFDEAVAAGLAAARAGVTAHDIAKAENDVFRRHGYGGYCSAEYTRVRGHGHGLHLDEVPIVEGVDTVLDENAVVIVHPNTYTPLAGYHVLGDPVLITATGCEILVSTERALEAVPA
ncbi:MAG: M24 family metallopeptidase [Solirubrobacterales bacterium]|nr:M24 family metallopeptidase [Solirubrobacterales bacterium]